MLGYELRKEEEEKMKQLTAWVGIKRRVMAVALESVTATSGTLVWCQHESLGSLPMNLGWFPVSVRPTCCVQKTLKANGPGC